VETIVSNKRAGGDGYEIETYRNRLKDAFSKIFQVILRSDCWYW
jgi:hypothetical protein